MYVLLSNVLLAPNATTQCNQLREVRGEHEKNAICPRDLVDAANANKPNPKHITLAGIAGGMQKNINRQGNNTIKNVKAETPKHKKEL